MFFESFFFCTGWLMLAAVAGSLRVHGGIPLELIDNCCKYQCGKIDEPLPVNSDGLGKKDYQYSELEFIFEQKDFKGEDPHESYCMINLFTLDYAMLNLTYYLDDQEPNYTVVIMDSVQIRPERKTVEEKAEGEQESKTFKVRGLQQDLESLLRNSSERSGRLNKFTMQNYRIPPSRLFTIAVKVDALKSKGVRDFHASIVADKGAPGRTFFIILGAVVVLFALGVPGSFLIYKRYFKKKKHQHRLQRRQVVRFNANASAARYRTDNARTAGDLEQDAVRASDTAELTQRRRLSLTERIRKATSRKFEGEVAPVLPKHELLKKQEQMRGSRRPISMVSPTQQTVECAYPGVEPGSERDSPPQTVERPVRGSRNRVVSHIMISEEEIHEDTEAQFPGSKESS